MKRLFLCFFWLITLTALAEEIPPLIYEGEKLDEYLIQSQDGQTVLHYLSQVPVPQGWTIAPVETLQNGFHEVTLLNTVNVPQDTLKGYFLDGFWIGRTPLNTPLLKRSSPTDGVQELYYFLEKDVRLNISYIGKMTSILNEDKIYPAFEACAPFHIILLTENQELFKNQVFIQNLFTVVKSYAKTICPSVSHIIFDATNDISLKEENIFFREDLYQHENGLWVQNPETSFNDFIETNTATPEETLAFIEMLPSIDRAAFVFSKTQIDSPFLLLKASELLNTPIEGVFVVHARPDDMRWIDYPFPMQVSNLEKNGWFLVKGYLNTLSDFEKKKSGLPLHEPAAFLEIEQAFSCTAEYCAEWQNPSFVLDKIEKLPTKEKAL